MAEQGRETQCGGVARRSNTVELHRGGEQRGGPDAVEQHREAKSLRGTEVQRRSSFRGTVQKELTRTLEALHDSGQETGGRGTETH